MRFLHSPALAEGIDYP